MLQGRLERIKGNRITGWVAGSGEVGEPVPFELLCNDRPVGAFEADRLRNDVVARGLATSGHGFEVELDETWMVPGLNVFAIRTPGATAALAGKVVVEHLPEIAALIASPDVPADLLSRVGLGGGTTAERPVTTVVKPSAPRRRALSFRAAETVPQSVVERALAGLVSATPNSVAVLEKVTAQLFREQAYQEVVVLAEAARGVVRETYPVLNILARSYLQLNRPEMAIVALEKVREREPKRHGALAYLGVAYTRCQLFQKAYDTLAACIALKEDEARYHFEAGRAATLLAYGGYGIGDHKPAYRELAISHFRRVTELDERDSRPWRELALLLLATNDVAAAHAAAEEAAARAGETAGAYLDLSRTHLRLGRYAEAAATARRALELAPNSDGAKFTVRISQRLQQSEAPEAPTLAILSGDPLPEALENVAGLSAVPLDGPPLSILRRLAVDWIAFGTAGLPDADRLIGDLTRFAGIAAGVLRFAGPAGETLLFRRDYLQLISDAGLLSPGASPAEIVRVALEPAFVYTPAAPGGPAEAAGIALPLAGTAAAEKGLVLLVSQFGIHKFGGAEQFLEQMSRIYRDLGHEVLVVGTRAEYQGQSGEADGIPYAFIPGTPEAIARLVITRRAAIVHVVSGFGFEIASVLAFLSTRLIFGVHFWREVFQNNSPSAGYFPDIDRDAVPRPEFASLLADAAAVYANSSFTRDEMERHFGIRAPVIYSLPYDVAEADVVPPAEDDRIVLLANARADKGFDMLVEVAARLPHVRFLAIASQSDQGPARARIDECGLANVTLIDRVDDMPALYRRSAVVLVPSFRFIETFSRVVIEAQRFGVPVIGADRGNVPHLLTESGTSLPEDPDLWAAEVDRLWTDPAYWSARSRAAFDNSAAYAFVDQPERLRRMVEATDSPVLVGVGSGLGNVIHTTPVIRNIARRLGRRVDVVVAGDYADLLFVAGNPDYVNHVFLLKDFVRRRRYEAVFLTHSFGEGIPSFSAGSVLSSRIWDNFTPDHPLHEAEFNLAAAEALLGIPYDRDDVRGYYLGELTWTAPEKPLIGFHGGSKDGIWATKRWPGYAELAQRLTAAGYDVASFGTSDEYVEGTIDRTGGSIQEMARSMLACSAFVANDSGVMNVANALGIPLISLFAPTNMATRGPLAVTSQAVGIGKDCSPCECHPIERDRSFMTGQCRCIGEIDVDVIEKAVLAIVAGQGA